MIQQNVNQLLSVGSLLATQTYGYKQAEKDQAIRHDLKQIGKLAKYEEQAYGAPEVKTLQKKEQLAEQLFENKPGEKTQEKMEEVMIELDERKTDWNQAKRKATEGIANVEKQKEKQAQDRETAELARSVILSRDDVMSKRALDELQTRLTNKRGGIM